MLSKSNCGSCSSHVWLPIERVGVDLWCNWLYQRLGYRSALDVW
jgi:hypothetical protein